MTDDVWTIKAALEWTQGYLARKGDENPRLSAEWLLAEATGLRRVELYVNFERPLSMEERDILRGYVSRRGAGEPLQYITGEVAFRHIAVKVRPGVLIPRPDTEVLVQTVVHELDSGADCRVLDLCAGSGCIGLAVASQVLRSRVLLGEWDEEALKVCRQNIRRNQLSARVTSLRMDAREKPSRQLGEFDCIVSNPPYIPTADIETLDPSVRDHEPHLALDGGADGLDFYRVIADKWRDALLPNGLMAFEVGIGQADEVLRIMRANGFGDIQIVKDLHGIPRVVYGRLCKEI